MSERNIGLEILDGIREIEAFERGEGPALRTRHLEGPPPPRTIREKLELSQETAGLAVPDKNL